MALILASSTCPFCGRLLKDGRSYGAFPAMFPRGHKYAICSDTGFHIECFERWAYSGAVKAIYEKYLNITENRPKIPEGMSFEKFQRSDEYQNYIKQIDEFLSDEQ